VTGISQPLDRSFDDEFQLMTAVGVDSLQALAGYIRANTKMPVLARHSADRRLVLAVYLGDMSRDFVVFFPITLSQIYRILEVKQKRLISFSTDPDIHASPQKSKPVPVPQRHGTSIAQHSDVVSSHREAAVPWLFVGGMVMLFLLFLGPGVVDDSRGVGYDCPSTVNMFLPGYKVINVNAGGAADLNLPLNAAYPNAHGVYYACRAKATWYGLAAFLVAAGAGTGAVLAVKKASERDAG
jgi:hypothetical protein